VHEASGESSTVRTVMLLYILVHINYRHGQSEVRVLVGPSDLSDLWQGGRATNSINYLTI